jgi:hypothetical protein
MARPNSSTTRFFTRFLAVGLVLAVMSCPRGLRADDLVRTASEVRSKYASQLDELAKWCDEHGLKEQAQKTRDWIRPRDPNRLYIADLPKAVGRAALPKDASAELTEWDTRFSQLRNKQASSLESLAQKAVRSDRASLAFDLILAGIHENPDHDGMRRLLGFVKYAGGWYTPFERDKLRSGQTWHSQFGWIPKSHVARYEQGLRPAGSSWISAAEDAKRHNSIETGWLIRTEHYDIQTNHSIQAGVALGVKLEQLYRVWKQLFVRYFATEDQVAELFDPRSRTRKLPPQRFKVVFFRDRDDYNRSLRGTFPNIDITVGVYENSTRRVYFFAGDHHNERTLYHEATHQLFQESRPVAPDVGTRGNFWIIEGIAMYMESLQHKDGYATLGGFDDLRMQAAQYRLLHDKFYVPFSPFCAMTVRDIQTDKRIGLLYSQAAGMAHFLIHYGDGRYRDLLVRYLDRVYSGRDSTATIVQLLGVPFSDLDKQYREYMENAGKTAATAHAASMQPDD